MYGVFFFFCVCFPIFYSQHKSNIVNCLFLKIKTSLNLILFEFGRLEERYENMSSVRRRNDPFENMSSKRMVKMYIETRISVRIFKTDVKLKKKKKTKHEGYRK